MMGWWSLLKSKHSSRYQSRRNKKEAADFKNTIDHQRGFRDTNTYPNEETRQWHAEQDFGHNDERKNNQLMENIVMRKIPKEHGVARRNITVSQPRKETRWTKGEDFNEEPARGKTFDHEAGSEQPTLDVHYARAEQNAPRPEAPDRHPLHPRYGSGVSNDVKMPQANIDARSLHNQRMKQTEDYWNNYWREDDKRQEMYGGVGRNEPQQ